MTDALTVALPPEIAEMLREAARRSGQTTETLASRLLSEAAIDLADGEAQLSEALVDDLRERLQNPGPLASPARIAALLAKLRS